MCRRGTQATLTCAWRRLQTPVNRTRRRAPRYFVASGATTADWSLREIRQAMGTPKGRTAGARYLAAFVEDMKASGFVPITNRR